MIRARRATEALRRAVGRFIQRHPDPNNAGAATARATPAPVVALVDLGNVCPNRDEQDHADALLLIGALLRSACPRPPGTPSLPIEIECRLYGGFRDINGLATERRAWVSRYIKNLRGLEGGVRVVPSHETPPVRSPPCLATSGHE